MSAQPEYFITPRIPGVRPKDPPDYDGYVFVYVFTRILNPWVVPPVANNVDVIVDNSQGFVPGMTIAVEAAGYYQVVQTTALNRMTIQNLPNANNAPVGTTIPPGNLTTTSLPGPKGDQGVQGIPGVAATVDVGATVTSPAGQNANVVNVGSQSQAVFNFTIPRGPTGPQGPQGAPGQAYNNVTTADFSAADAPTLQTLSLQSTTGLFSGVVLDINPIGYYQIQSVLSGTQVRVVNTMTPGNSAAGTVSPSGSAVLGTGPQGPPGIPASITAGNTSTLAPGNPAAVTQRGSATAAIFDFAIPQGALGAPGATGAQGPPGTNGVDGTTPTVDAGTTATLSPGQPAAVTQRGTPTAVIFDFAIPQGAVGATGPAGATGPQGATGPVGTAATVAAGTTSTGLPGTNAAVTNSGTASAAVFNFTIPRGDVGAQGPAGAAGAQGPTGKNSFTLSAADFTVPPVGQNVQVTLTDASWVTVGQMIAVQNAGGSATVAGSLQCTAKSGNTITLTNVAGSAVPIADSSQDGLLRKVSGLTTDFVDGTNNCRDLATAVQPTIWSARLRSFNAIGNPTFEVTQCRCGAQVANPGTTLHLEDRWFVNNSGALAFTYQDLGPTSPILLPGTNFAISSGYIRLVVSTAKPTLAAGDLVGMYQQIEGPLWRELSLDVHSLSVLVRSSVAVKFGLVLRDPAATRSLSKLCTYTSPNTWALIPLPNLPTWASGGGWTANPGVAGYLLNLVLACGSTSMSPANDTWQTGNFVGAVGQDNFFANAAGATFDVAFIQHEPGPQCTTPIDKPFQQNYDECLRYFCKSYNYAVAPNTASAVGYIAQVVAAGGNPLGGARFPKPMAKVPTITGYSAAGGVNAVYDATGATNRAISAVYGAPGETGFGGWSLATQNAGAAIYQWHYSVDTGW